MPTWQGDPHGRVSDCVFDMSSCMDSGETVLQPVCSSKQAHLTMSLGTLQGTMGHTQGPQYTPNSIILHTVHFMAACCQSMPDTVPTSVNVPEPTQRVEKWPGMGQVHINSEGLWDIKETHDWLCLRRVVAKVMAQLGHRDTNTSLIGKEGVTKAYGVCVQFQYMNN